MSYLLLKGLEIFFEQPQKVRFPALMYLYYDYYTKTIQDGRGLKYLSNKFLSSQS